MEVRRVLLIDDNDDQRSILASALRSRGWTVEAARNGAQGIAAAQRAQPEVVLTELILPDVRGFDYARSLRSMVDHDLVVIAVTRIPEELHRRALSAGFDLIVRKPLEADELCRRLFDLRAARAS